MASLSWCNTLKLSNQVIMAANKPNLNTIRSNSFRCLHRNCVDSLPINNSVSSRCLLDSFSPVWSPYKRHQYDTTGSRSSRNYWQKTSTWNLLTIVLKNDVIVGGIYIVAQQLCFTMFRGCFQKMSDWLQRRWCRRKTYCHLSCAHTVNSRNK